MNFKKYVAQIALALSAAFLITGCAGEKPSEKAVAVINDYKMTVNDFNYESKDVLSTAKLFAGMPVTKEDVLDALIIKELLLQEAQEKGLDKDRDFMRTIELYWEQTLIKNLLSKESRQIAGNIAVYENEILDYYNKMKNEIRASVLVLADEKAARKLAALDGSAAELARTETAERALLYMVPSRLYSLGERGSLLENSIFDIGAGKSKGLAAINGNWALILIEERVPVEPKPLSDARAGIIDSIKMRKERDLMNKWIEGLRTSARIKINRKVFEELK